LIGTIFSIDSLNFYMFETLANNDVSQGTKYEKVNK